MTKVPNNNNLHSGYKKIWAPDMLPRIEDSNVTSLALTEYQYPSSSSCEGVMTT